MAEAAPMFALAATGLKAAGSIMGGISTSQGDQTEAQQAINAAEIGKTKAAETDMDMRRKLGAQLSNIMAVRASSGLNPMSPTGQAISSNVEARGDVNRTQAVANIMAQVKTDQSAAAFYTHSASMALTGGIMGGIGDIFSGLSGPLGSMGGSPGASAAGGPIYSPMGPTGFAVGGN